VKRGFNIPLFASNVDGASSSIAHGEPFVRNEAGRILLSIGAITSTLISGSLLRGVSF
jgi:hypothetical protein